MSTLRQRLGRWTVGGCLLTTAWVAPTFAEGWKWFSKAGTSSHTVAADSKREPALNGHALVHHVSPESGEHEASGPGPLSRFGQSTSKMFAKARSAISSPRDEERVISHYELPGTPSTSKPRRALFSSWFRPREPRPPQTAQDFLALPRPGI